MKKKEVRGKETRERGAGTAGEGEKGLPAGEDRGHPQVIVQTLTMMKRGARCKIH